MNRDFHHYLSVVGKLDGISHKIKKNLSDAARIST